MIYDDMRAQLDSALRDRDAMGAALTRADEYAAAALARAEAAERELHQWRTGHHLSEYQEALNEMQGRAVDAEAKLAAAEATIAKGTYNDGYDAGYQAAESTITEITTERDEAEAAIARGRQAAAEVRANGDASSESAADYIEAALAGPKDGE